MESMTLKELRAFIQSHMEDEETPQRVLEWAQQHQGKQLRSNQIPDGFGLTRRYGMAHLETPDYRQTQGREGTSFLLGYGETGITVPSPEALQEMNPAYYSARRRRNNKRRERLESDQALEVAFNAIAIAMQYRALYRDAVQSLSELFPHDDGEHYSILEMVSLDVREAARGRVRQQ